MRDRFGKHGFLCLLVCFAPKKTEHFSVLHNILQCLAILLAGKNGAQTETEGKDSKQGQTTWAAHGKEQQSKWEHHHHHMHSRKRESCKNEDSVPGESSSGSDAMSGQPSKLRRMTQHVGSPA